MPVCVCYFVKVFAKPLDQQEPEIFFYSMMFLVIAGGSGITMFLEVTFLFFLTCLEEKYQFGHWIRHQVNAIHRA